MYHLETKIESQGENITLNGTANAKFEKFGIGGNSSQETREEFKSTVTGTEVTVNDTYINNQTKFNIDGNSYQETREGYNLLNVPAEYTVLSTENNKEVPISLKANITYTIKIGQINTDNTDVTRVLFRFRYNKGDISNPYVYVNLSDLKAVCTPASDVDAVWIYSGRGYNESALSNTTFEDLMIYEGTEDKPYEPYTGGIPSPSPDYPQEITNVGGYDNLFDKNNIIDGSFIDDSSGAFVSNSTSKRTGYIEIQANSYYYIYSDKTSGNWGAWYDKDKKFISGITLKSRKEDVVNSPSNAKYMAFTVSYRGNLTDYSNIKINETAIKIKHSGKNWFDNTKVSPIVLLSYSNGIYSASDNDTATTLAYKIQQFDSDRKYISLAGEVKQNINKPGIYYFTAQKYTTAKYLRIGNIGKTKEFQLYYPLDDINVGDYYTLVLNIIDTTIGASKFKDVMLLKGKITSANYEPYHEPIITPINLQGNILSKVGNVKDILKINRNGEVEIKKNIGKVILDGTENWKGYEESKDTAAAYLRMSDLTKTQNSNILCNKFQQINYEQDKEGIVATPYSAVLIAIRINKSRLTENSLPGIKTWLSQHPTEVYYQLATPQTISLPSISPIELWQGTNIFSLITNLDTEIELEYNYIPQSPSPEAPSEIKNVKDNINIKIADKNNEEQQEILFPLVQGQKLMQGDYLADDGIHHTRKQIVFNGKEEWKLGGRQFDKCMTFYVYARDGNTRGAKICNLFKFDDMAYIDRKDTECITNNVLGRNFFNNYSNKKVKIENRKCCGISRIFVEAIQ